LDPAAGVRFPAAVKEGCGVKPPARAAAAPVVSAQQFGSGNQTDVFEVGRHRYLEPSRARGYGTDR